MLVRGAGRSGRSFPESHMTTRRIKWSGRVPWAFALDQRRKFDAPKPCRVQSAGQPGEMGEGGWRVDENDGAEWLPLVLALLLAPRRRAQAQRLLSLIQFWPRLLLSSIMSVSS